MAHAAEPKHFADGDVTIETRNAVAVITLNRPRALNALTNAMRQEIAKALPIFARDPVIYALVIRSASDRAFCAGGDVRELVSLAESDLSAAHEALAFEYRLNWMLECFPKPTVSLIDGFVAGSGVGLTSFGTHKVAGPNYRFAMPETVIGLFPDVGICHPLARLPNETGTYLALTGNTIERDDARALDLASHRADGGVFDEIVDELADAKPIDALLDRLCGSAETEATPTGGAVYSKRDQIQAWFSGSSVTDIFDRLETAAKEGSGDARLFAANTLETLRSRSPISLVVTLRHLRAAADMDIRETLIGDYRLAQQFLADRDFAEGVRALLIDKDRSPNWQVASIADVTGETLAPYFDDHKGEPLELPLREDMQRFGG